MTFEERTQLLNKMDHAKAYFNKKTDLYEQIIDIDEYTGQNIHPVRKVGSNQSGQKFQ